MQVVEERGETTASELLTAVGDVIVKHALHGRPARLEQRLPGALERAGELGPGGPWSSSIRSIAAAFGFVPSSRDLRSSATTVARGARRTRPISVAKVVVGRLGGGARKSGVCPTCGWTARSTSRPSPSAIGAFAVRQASYSCCPIGACSTRTAASVSHSGDTANRTRRASASPNRRAVTGLPYFRLSPKVSRSRCGPDSLVACPPRPTRRQPPHRRVTAPFSGCRGCARCSWRTPSRWPAPSPPRSPCRSWSSSAPSPRSCPLSSWSARSSRMPWAGPSFLRSPTASPPDGCSSGATSSAHPASG